MSMFLCGKEVGLDNAEFYLRHIHPTNNETEKALLTAAAEVIRQRKSVVIQERLTMSRRLVSALEEKKKECVR